MERDILAKRIGFEYSDKKTALDKLMLTNGEKLLNAGMVLFCDSLYSEIQMAIFAGKERLTFLGIQRERAPIFELIVKAERYIASNIRWRVEFDGSLQRKEIPEIPMDAVREALTNSFCHKDFGSCQTNEVAIHPDRVEIYNPGTFPKGLTPEDFIDGKQRPVRRNPLIASILYYSKDIESFGTGLKRIVDACTESGCKCAFEVLKSGFVVVFHRKSPTDVSEYQNDPIKSTDKETMLLDAIRRNPSSTYSELAGSLNISSTTIKRMLQNLISKKKIERFGSNKKGGWKILEGNPEGDQ